MNLRMNKQNCTRRLDVSSDNMAGLVNLFFGHQLKISNAEFIEILACALHFKGKQEHPCN